MKKGAPNFEMLRKSLLSEDWDAVVGGLSAKATIQKWSRDRFKIDGNHVMFDDVELPSDLSSRISEMVRKGEDAKPFFNFWERLRKNPSYRSVHQLWNFLKNKNIPLTPDGHFLAYKSVRDDYKDHHSGTFTNKPGTVNEMTRNQISDDSDHECDPGFHVGAIEYARTFGSGGRVVICKVDPEDVVSVPRDYNGQKMRVCKYEVIGNYGDDLSSTLHAQDESELVDDAIGDDAEGEDTPDVVEIVKQDTGPATSKTKGERKRNKKFVKMDAMGTKELLALSLDDLRQYAGKGLNIVGASKIAGGKVALIGRIGSVRKKG